MKYTLTLKDEQGEEHSFTLNRSGADEPKNLNDFILEALRISEDKRELPFITFAPNGTETYPSLKMFFREGSSLLGDEIKAMCVGWG